MSRSWGFDLDMTAIRLMRRDAEDWVEVAVEKIDGPDIEDRLMAMVDQVDKNMAVTVFLPKDQILYTDVETTATTIERQEIEIAMDGRTPYPISELKIDWQQNGGTVRVAAIACETLDEAFAFAEARGLQVKQYSSLADGSDFPKLPDFGGPDVLEGSEAVESVPFATMRDDRVRTEPIISSDPNAGQDGPVVEVDDTTPVMQVTAREEPPLNPGAVLNPELAAPRVSTDIAASTISDEVGATLTPSKQGIRVRGGGRAVPTLLIFAIAFLLTIGVAYIVWSVLPLAPTQVTEEPTSQISEPTTQDTAAVETPEEQPEQQAAASIPDLPAPIIVTDVLAEFAAPKITNAKSLAPASFERPALPRATPDLMASLNLREIPPLAADSAPLPPRPVWLTDVPVAAPAQSPNPRIIWDETTNRIYIASIEPDDLSFDAIALPNASRFAPDEIPVIEKAPAAPTDQDAEATAEVDTEVSSEEEAVETTQAAIDRAVLESITPESETEQSDAPEVVEADDGLPKPTEFAASLTDLAPRARPSGFVDDIERQRYGGRTKAELAQVRPGKRPESEQMAALKDLAESGASELAVAASITPRNRPGDFDAIVAQALIQREAARVTASLEFDTPDTSAAIEAALADDAEPEVRPQDSPRLAIPSSASVARQATIENAIKLNKINLVGVYGSPSDRRALLRLSSGRYVKVKVGDRIDGGTVAEITDKELRYRKGRRTVSLSIPQG